MTAIRPEREDARALTVVGLGGSAGSIPALEAFFQGLIAERDRGRAHEGDSSAYVVVVHLSPDFESRLAEVLSRSTSFPVQQVTESVKIERGHVYVIPPGKHLEMQDGMLGLRDLKPERGGTRVAIDTFFRTLAQAHGPQAAAIVLSGTGADGTLGIRQIKEVGGLAVAQSPGEAEYDAMPRSAIATGLVDYVLPASAMAAQIASYWETSRKMHLPEEAAPSPEQRKEGPDQEAALRDVLEHVRAQTGHDFTLYKRATVLRRVGRRMQVNGTRSLPAYRNFLSGHPAEVGDLVGDLLISVTQFFRDLPAWEALEQDIIPRLFQNKQGADDEVRAWVCGCATGEEAYTVAMLLLERAARTERALRQRPRVQVFATDMDTDAIARARSGVYPETIAGDISEERLRRWFYRHNGSYQVNKELREAVLFASHDVLRDTPFSRVDLVTCRNLLIYLNREAQERAFETFHFALRPEGRLLLGPSESADSAASLFGLTDRQHRIYVRRPVARGIVPMPPVLPAVAPVVPSVLPARHAFGRDLSTASIPLLPVLPAMPPPQRPVSGGRELLLNLMERYGPPTALIDEGQDIVHLSNGAGRFLRVADGEPTRNLLQMVHPDLRIELRAALYAAAAEGTDQVRLFPGGIALTEVRPPVPVRLMVRPILDTTEGAHRYFLVQFEEMPADLPANASAAPSITPSAGSAFPSDTTVSVAPHSELARRLEEENATLQRQLRSTIEQYEAMTEELKASNEELQAMNEEQRSAAEELETSKEELQSVNEELSTVNHELKARVEEVSRTNSDLQNFLASTDIGTLFLDRELRIKRYTPAAESLFNLISTDAGRPLAHITHRLDYPALPDDAESVLARLQPVEREVSTTDGTRHFLARLLPYRSMDDRIEGVVINFVDVTERRRAEEGLRVSEEQFRRAIEDAPIPMIMHAEDGQVLRISRTWTALTGYTLADVPTLDAWLSRSAYGDGADTVRDYMRNLFASDRSHTMNAEFSIRTRSGAVRHWSFSASSPGTLGDGRRFIVGMAVDVTERRQAEERFRLLVDAARDYAMLQLDAQNRITFWSAGAERIFGWTEQEALGQSSDMIFTPEDRVARVPQQEQEIALRTGRAEDERWHLKKDGTRFFASGVMTPLHDPDTGVLRGLGKVLRDITERKQAEDELRASSEALRESEARFRAVANLVPDLLWSNDEQGHMVWFNRRWSEYTGQVIGETTGHGWLDAIHPDDRQATLTRFQGAANIGISLEHDLRIRRSSDETYRWFLVRAEPVRDLESWGMVRWLGAATDIHEQRMAFSDMEIQVAERTESLTGALNALESAFTERQALVGRLVTAQEEERRRISRELHDQMGQLLTGFALGLKSVEGIVTVHCPPESGATEMLTRLRSVTHDMGQEVHRIAVELRPTALDDLGLVPALRAHVEEWAEHVGIPTQFTSLNLPDERLSPLLETTIYRVVQEALTNAAKYAVTAGATRVTVTLQRMEDLVQTTVEDDGPGFSMEEADRSGRLGLAGMRERAELVSGTLDIESTPGQGTAVYLRVPISAPQIPPSD